MLNLKQSTTKFYNSQRSAMDWLADQCNAFGITPPSAILFDIKAKIGLTNKERKGSPVYYAHRTDCDNIVITFSTFAKGGYNETFRTGEKSSANPVLKVVKKVETDKPKEDLLFKIMYEYIRGTDDWSVDTHSHYLYDSIFRSSGQYEDDRVQNYASKVLGIRYYQAGIYIPLFDVDGIARAIQVIRNGGKDKKIYGSVKGNFAIIGDIESARNNPYSKKPKYEKNTIHVCEGVRTGLATHILTGAPVVCAMSAHFIDEVVKNLTNDKVKDERVGSRKNWRLVWDQVVIAADNDRKEGEKTYQNTGLVMANRVARKYPRVTWVAAPVNSGDWWDVLKSQGKPLAAKEYFQFKKADLNYALAKKPFKWEADQVPGVRYLPSLDVDEGITLVRSPIGTGKTHSLKLLSQYSQSFLYVSHLVSLANDASNRLNLELYSDSNTDITNAPKLSICLNSLPRLITDGKIKPYEYLVIDEFEQLLKRLSGKDIENRRLIFSILEYLLNNCRHVILLDAHLGVLTNAFLSNLGTNRPIHRINNHYKIGEGRVIVDYTDRMMLLEEAVRTLNDGKRAYIALNSKKDAHDLYVELLRQGKKGLYISGDNSGNKEVKAFFANVNEEQKRYDFIVTTPSTNTGVSIDSTDGVPAFDFVGFIGINGITTHTDAIQAFGRVRDTKRIHIWIEDSTRNVQTREEVQASWLTSLKESSDYIELTIDSEGNLTMPDIDVRRGELKINTTIARQKSFKNYKLNVLRELYNQGYTFESVYPPDDILAPVAIVEKLVNRVAMKKEGQRKYNERVSKAPDIDESQREKLESKHRKTMSETDSITKKEILDFYKFDLESDTTTIVDGVEKSGFDMLIEADNRGRMRKCVANAELALSSLQDIDIKIEKQANSDKMYADYIPYDAKSTWFMMLLNLACELRDYGDYSEDSEVITNFIATVKDMPLTGAFAKKPTKSGMKFLGEQFRRLGISHKSRKVQKSRVYSVDNDTLNQLFGYLETRNPGITSKLS